MKAAAVHEFGTPLTIEEIDTPVLGSGQVNDAITQVEKGEVEARLVFDLR